MLKCIIDISMKSIESTMYQLHLRRKLFIMLLHTCYAKNYANIMNTGLYIVSKQSEVAIRG